MSAIWVLLDIPTVDQVAHLSMNTDDEYIQRLASFIRANEARLAQSPFLYPKNSLSWLRVPFYGPQRPVILSIQYHHLYDLLLRLEALGLPVGPLDVSLDIPSHPAKYISLSTHSDRSEVLSLNSFRSSLSAITSLSLPSYWWLKRDPRAINIDLKYIYSCFTKLPAILIKAAEPNSVPAMFRGSLDINLLPLDVFKNMQNLECVDIDPRILIGWDRLAESLRSLKIRRSGIEDLSDIFLKSILHDEARRGSGNPHPHPSQNPDLSSHDGLQEERGPSFTHQPVQAQNPPLLSWTFLKYLSLRENAMTFFPMNIVSCLTSLTHLDLASNLLVSVPSGLATLYNLIFLDLSDNLIDTVLGIYTELVQIQTLHLTRNRLESICGLERLKTLSRVDLRQNLIQESAEIGRLSTLPNIAEVWVDGNPFLEREENYRLKCFDMFWKEGKVIRLDGATPNILERSGLSHRTPEPVSTLQSVPSVTTNDEPMLSSDTALHSDELSLSQTGRVGRLNDLSNGTYNDRARKKVKRVVQLNNRRTEESCTRKPLELEYQNLSTSLSADKGEPSYRPRQPVRHGRYHTEIQLREDAGTSEVACMDDSFLSRQQGSLKGPSLAKSEGQDLRTRIALLKRDIGDGWLGAFSGEV